MYLRINKNDDSCFVECYTNAEFKNVPSEHKSGFEWYPDNVKFDPDKGLDREQEDSFEEESGRYYYGGEWKLKKDNQKKLYVEMIKKYANNVRREVSQNKAPEQLMSEFGKLDRAKRILSDSATPDDNQIIDAEISIREKNETRKELAQKQINKGMLFSVANAKIDALESKAIDKINKAKTKRAMSVSIIKLRKEAELLKENLFNV